MRLKGKRSGAATRGQKCRHAESLFCTVNEAACARGGCFAVIRRAQERDDLSVVSAGGGSYSTVG